MALQRQRSQLGNHRQARARMVGRNKPRVGILDSKNAVVSENEWKIYKQALSALRKKGIPLMLGGGFAQGAFTGRWRNTKDIDLYVLPSDRERAIAVLTAAGFEDYYERLPYDRKWIYRSYKSECIVDLIWAMANQRATVGTLWFQRAPTMRVRGTTLKVIPVEELIWCKLYILQRDRCDWADIFNLLHMQAQTLDWSHLFCQLEDDLPLLQGLLTIFCWLHPNHGLAIPASVRECLRLPDLSSGSAEEVRRSWRERVRLLDSRAWFTALSDKLET